MNEALKLDTQANRDALNQHGVFLKKRVVQEIRGIRRMSVHAEEFAVSFESSTAIDLVAQSDPVMSRTYGSPNDGAASQHLWFILECKKVYAKEKRWVFFRDLRAQFRKYRSVGPIGVQSSTMAGLPPATGDHPVCSEGYELASSRKDSKANPDPIFCAGNQLARGYLGFIARQIEKANINLRNGGIKNDHRIVPVLVTNASLAVAEFDIGKVSLHTGNLEDDLGLLEVDWLVLKHPFSVPHLNTERDFRNLQDGDDQTDQQMRESIYVVQADKLKSLFSEDTLDWFQDN